MANVSPNVSVHFLTNYITFQLWNYKLCYFQ